MRTMISQLIEVLERIHGALDGHPLQKPADVREARLNATKAIAQERGINVQPVVGKCTRHLGYKVAEFDGAVLGWLRDGDPALECRVGEYLDGRRFWRRPEHTVSESDEAERGMVRQFFSRHRRGQPPRSVLT